MKANVTKERKVLILANILVVIHILVSMNSAIGQSASIYESDSLLSYFMNSIKSNDNRGYPACFIYTINNGILPLDYNINQLDSLLIYGSEFDRLTASAILSQGLASDTLTIINILLNTLRDEIEKPFSFDFIHGSYLPITEFLKQDYCLALINLVGDKDWKQLAEIADTLEGELKYRILLTLGYFDNREIKSEIRRLYDIVGNNYLKSIAIDVISRHPDTLDIPIIEKSLNNGFSTFNSSDNNTFFPIRNKAFATLRILGLKATKQGDKYIIQKNDE